MTARILKISSEEDLAKAFDVRYEVFVLGQNVPADLERDENDHSAFHFIAMLDDRVVGACRWRNTNDGAKLERFAVLEAYRGKGIGQALVKAVLQDIKDQHPHGVTAYLNSQVDAQNLYARLNFQPKGELFEEAGILHQYMEQRLG